MATRWRTTASLLILLCLLPELALAQRRARLLGKVVDTDGKPIPGVTVTATSPNIPNFKEVETTDGRGMFIIDFREINVTYHYRFDKAGYLSIEVNQEWRLEGTQQVEWKMAPAATVAASGLRPASTSQMAISAFNEGVAALNAKNFAIAEAKFSEAVGHDPKLARGWAALSGVQVNTGRNAQAAEAAEKAIELGIRDEAVMTARWQAYRNMKDETKAAQALKDLE